MILTAKHASSACPTCSKPIAIGSRIEWSPGSKAVHVECAPPASKVSSAKSATSARRSTPRRRRGARYCEGWGADNPHAPRAPYTCPDCLESGE